MNGWKRDKERADIFMPTIKAVLGRLFIGDAPVVEDQQQATDLMVFHISPLTVACRMRDLSYFKKYPNEITIRYSRPGGTKTEYDKLVDGWADYFFYGFGNFSTGKIHAYNVLSLDALRAALIRNNKPIYQIKDNHDGSSRFLAINLTRLPENCVVHSYRQAEVAA